MDNKKIFDFTEDDKVKNIFHNFETQGEIVGILVNIEPGKFGKDQYIIETPDKKKVTIGSLTALNERISHEDIGKAIKIVYLGIQKTKDGKNSFKNFDVYLKEIK